MANSQGFWSYVHADDQAEGERISRLARDVAAQFEMLTGEPLALLLDRDAIKWGEVWRDKIDSSLASVAFFIPVLTPRYFMSAECRRELQFFARQATRLGIKELVLPLLYVDVPSLHDETAGDDLIRLVRTFQWEDWRELRFFDVAAEGYRRGVAELAARLVEANRQLEKADRTAIALQADDSLRRAVDDSPGFLDQIATAEETLPGWWKQSKRLVEISSTLGRYCKRQ
jgi:TIR domain